MCFTLSFGTRQVNKVEFACCDSLLAGFIFFSSFNINCENGVTSGRVDIHGRLASLSRIITFFHELLDLCNSLDDTCSEILDIDTFVFILFQIQLVINIFGQQVSNLLVIYFQV